jgi:hypothetical protein
MAVDIPESFDADAEALRLLVLYGRADAEQENFPLASEDTWEATEVATYFTAAVSAYQSHLQQTSTILEASIACGLTSNDQLGRTATEAAITPDSRELAVAGLTASAEQVSCAALTAAANWSARTTDAAIKSAVPCSGTEHGSAEVAAALAEVQRQQEAWVAYQAAAEERRTALAQQVAAQQAAWDAKVLYEQRRAADLRFAIARRQNAAGAPHKDISSFLNSFLTEYYKAGFADPQAALPGPGAATGQRSSSGGAALQPCASRHARAGGWPGAWRHLCAGGSRTRGAPQPCWRAGPRLSSGQPWPAGFSAEVHPASWLSQTPCKKRIV